MIRSVRLVCLALLAAVMPAPGITLLLDYTYDIQDGGNFFGLHSAAKSTLEQAAADLGAAITSSLAAVPTDTFTGSSGGASATINWSLFFTNPVTGAEIEIPTWDSTVFPANTIRLYVGMQPLVGSTLGQGGPGATSYSLMTAGSGANLISAVNQAETASNATMTRGGGNNHGPVMGSDSGTIGGASFTLRDGIILGNLWFDNDTDDLNGIDSESTLDSFWHFELASPNDGQNDFYSVALHELMHAIGFGAELPDTSTWRAKHSGTTWNGTEAKSLDPDNGVNLLAPDLSHIRNGVSSFRLSDSSAQEAVMDPSITTGTRKSLTQLDLAFLRDIGYATVPEPSTAALLAFALALTSRRTIRRPVSSAGKSCLRS